MRRPGPLLLAALTAWPLAFALILVATVVGPRLAGRGGPLSASTTALAAALLATTALSLGLTLFYVVHALRSRALPAGERWTWAALLALPAAQLAGAPPLAAALLVLVERLLGWGIHDPALGGDPVLLQHLLWLYRPPVIPVIAAAGAAVQLRYGWRYVWRPRGRARRSVP